ncbi:transcription termination factor Rho [Pseudoscardovia suis]|nr:transcription termination factor Rho [Pseudoscardovia suis]
MADSQNLSSLTVAELREKAKNMGLKGFTGLRKSDLVNRIEQSLPQPAEASAASSERVSVEEPTPLVRVADTGAGRRVTRSAGQPIHFDFDDVRSKRNQAPSQSPRKENAAEESAHTGQLDLNLDLPRRRHRGAESRDNGRNASVAAELDNILANLPNRAHDAANTPLPPNSQHAGRATGGQRNDYADRNDRVNRRDMRNQRNDRNDRFAERSNDRRNVRNDRNDRNERGNARVREERVESYTPVAGIVDVLDSYAFIRTSGYLPGPNDVYVSMSQVRKYGLRKGDAVRGYTKANGGESGRGGNGRNAHQKFVPLQGLETINGMSVEEAAQRPQFSKLTPLYPQERLKMETTPNRLVGRLIDLCAPIGKGQRGLIVSPPKAGKTITLQQIANAITTNNPEVHLMVVLVDERPEEVTDMQRTVQGEIISSTFDRPASDHTIVAELAIERAKRLVELGQDVVVLLDSMTRLARAYNIAAPASGRILSGGVDAQALYPPKKFFGAARNIENGGSLTIIASALVETGSKMDEVIFEEFKGTGNMELRLSRDLAEKRMFPAIDINASGTRREELITDPKELMIIYRLRRALGGMEPEQAYNAIVPRMKKTATNRDFLAALATGQNPNAA